MILLNALSPGLLEPLTPDRAGYERFFSCWLCRAELLAQAEWVVYVGESYAASLDDIPALFFRVAYDDDSAAFQAMIRTNNARELARMQRQAAAERATGIVRSRLM